LSQPERDDDDGGDDSLARMFEAIRRGDRDGFDRLLGKYRPLIGGIVSNQMHHRLRSVLEPEDVVQDVLIAAYRGMGGARFAGEAGFEAWLRTLVTNRLRDLGRQHFKTAKRPSNVRSLDDTVSGSVDGHVGDFVAGDGPGPSTVVGRRELAERLFRALASCRPAVRELIILVFVEKLPINEIAIRQGRSPEAVRKALSRALDDCREALQFLPHPERDGDA
jgi:RNA polymerase sigma-70 factor (ECF subfamily)